MSHEDMSSCDCAAMAEISEVVEHLSRVIEAVEFTNVSSLPFEINRDEELYPINPDGSVFLWDSSDVSESERLCRWSGFTQIAA